RLAPPAGRGARCRPGADLHAAVEQGAGRVGAGSGSQPARPFGENARRNPHGGAAMGDGMKPRASAKNRASAALAIAAAVLAGVSLFWTAQRVQTAESRLQHLQEAAAAEKQAIHVLRAEWDYLNRPERLEALARQHLNMTPPQPGNVVGSSAALAEPPPAPLVRKPAIRPQPA